MRHLFAVLLLCVVAIGQEPLVTARVHTNMVGFVQSTSLAAARATLGLTEHINFNDYSPAADGLTDDGPKLTTAIAAAVSAGKALYIPSGTYAIQSQVNVYEKSNITIIGDGYDRTKIVSTNWTAFGDSPALNKVVNGTFDTDLSSWTAGAGWAWNAGTATHTAGDTATLEQSYSVTLSSGARSLFVISGRTAGTVTATLLHGATTTATWQCSTNGPYSIGGIPGSGSYTATIRFTPSSDFDGAIDTVISGVSNGIDPGAYLLYFRNPNDLLIEGITFDGNPLNQRPFLGAGQCIYIQSQTGDTRNVTIRACKFTGFRFNGIETKGTLPDYAGIGYVFKDNIFRLMQQDTNCTDGAALALGLTEGALVENNLFDDCGSNWDTSHSIYQNNSAVARGTRILNNTFLSKIKDAWTNNPTSYGDGFNTWHNSQVKTGSSVGNVVANNYWHGIYEVKAYGKSETWVNNYFTNSFPVIDGPEHLWVGNRFDVSTNVSNGVIIGFGSSGFTNCTMRGNLFKTWSPLISDANWRAVSGLPAGSVFDGNRIEGSYALTVGSESSWPANIIIRNNVVEHRTATGNGAGFRLYATDAIAENNYINIGYRYPFLIESGTSLRSFKGNQYVDADSVNSINAAVVGIVRDTDKPIWRNATTTERASLDSDANVITGGAATFDTGTWTIGSGWTDGGAGTYSINSTTVGTHSLSFTAAAGTTKIGRRYSGSVTLTGASTITGTGTTLTVRLGGVTLATFTTGQSSVSFTGIRLTAASSDVVQLVATIAAGGTVTATATSASITIWAEGDVIDEQIVPATYGIERVNEWYDYTASVLTANNANTKRLRLFIGGTVSAVPVEIWTYSLPTSVAARGNVRAQLFYITANTMKACVWYDDGANQSTTWTSTITFPTSATFATEHHVCLVADTDDAAADVTFSMSSIVQNRRWNP